MSKSINLTGISLGSALEELSIYYNELTPDKLIVTGVLPQQLLDGYTITTPDSATKILIRCESGLCDGRVGSLDLPLYVQNTRWFTVNSDGNGTVEVVSPVAAGPTTTFISQSVNFSNFSQFVIAAAASYPFSFTGWYDAATGGNLVSTNNPLTITRDTFTSTDDFYAYFS